MNSKEMDYLKKVCIESNEKMKDSACFMSIFSDNYMNDPVCMMQLGLSIMLEKPFFLLVPVGIVIPGRILKIADKIVHYDPGCPDSLKKATKELAEYAIKNLK